MFNFQRSMSNGEQATTVDSGDDTPEGAGGQEARHACQRVIGGCAASIGHWKSVQRSEGEQECGGPQISPICADWETARRCRTERDGGGWRRDSASLVICHWRLRRVTGQQSKTEQEVTETTEERWRGRVVEVGGWWVVGDSTAKGAKEREGGDCQGPSLLRDGRRQKGSCHITIAHRMVDTAIGL